MRKKEENHLRQINEQTKRNRDGEDYLLLKRISKEKEFRFGLLVRRINKTRSETLLDCLVGVKEKDAHAHARARWLVSLT